MLQVEVMVPDPVTLDQASEQARRAERVRTILGARVVFNSGRSSIDCQIRNISETGARLTLNEGLSLPGTFDLEIPSRNKTHRVLLRWRTKDAAGVQFIDDSAKAAVDHGTAAEELEALRKENGMLKRRVADLVRRLADLGHSEWQR
ncbi:MAG: PilZ protein [Hyphomicrobiales bacterium]|nr:PilZ protein [Hyphomicrobiales bacterium]